MRLLPSQADITTRPGSSSGRFRRPQSASKNGREYWPQYGYAQRLETLWKSGKIQGYDSPINQIISKLREHHNSAAPHNNQIGDSITLLEKLVSEGKTKPSDFVGPIANLTLSTQNLVSDRLSRS